MHLHIIGSTWKRSSPQVEVWEPHLTLFDENAQEKKQIAVSQYTFGWQLSKERTCTGYYRDKQYVPCPYSNNLAVQGHSQCSYCQRVEGFRDAFLFKQEPTNETMRRYMQQNQFIYLALFFPDIVKVGTAVHYRGEKRLVEQDAQYYIFIAEVPDGLSVQNFEHAIAQQCNIREMVQGRVKKAGLFNTIQQEKAEALLTQKYQKVHSMFRTHDEFGQYLKDASALIVKNLTNSYYFINGQSQVIPLSATPVVFGQGCGIRGKLLLTEYAGTVNIFPLQAIVGRHIVGYDVQVPDSLVLPSQPSLF